MITKKLTNGFGLIEMMVAVFVLALVVAASAVFFGYYVKNSNFSFQQGQMVANADYLFSRINAEIREMKISEEGGYPLIVAGDTEIAFYSDSDNDGVVERVRYFLNDDKIYRGVVEPNSESPAYDLNNEQATVVASDVVNTTPIFYYYNQNWPSDPTNNPLIEASRLINSRLIKVELFINNNPEENTDFQINTEISIRNLKSN